MVKEGKSVFDQMCVGHVKGHRTLTELNDTAKRAKPEPFNEDSCDEIPSESIPEKREKKKKVSKNDSWLASDLMSKCCINDVGAALPKEECESNIRAALKSKKDIDFYEFIEISCQPGLTEEKLQKCLLACSLFAFMNRRDKTACPSSSDDPTKCNEPVGFKLQDARLVDRSVVFPGDFRVKITDLLTPMIVSKWVLTDDVASSIAAVTREICKELHKNDPFFPFYTTPTTTPRKVSYVILDDSIVDNLCQIMTAGFGLENTEANTVKLLSQISSTLYSFIDKRRSEFNKKHGEGSCLASAKDFRDRLMTSPNFRSNYTQDEMDMWERDSFYSGIPEYDCEPSPSTSRHYMDL
ncbi:unnamed protein product [Caenorhabditis brenneri]